MGFSGDGVRATGTGKEGLNAFRELISLEVHVLNGIHEPGRKADGPLAALERLFVSHVNRRHLEYEFHRLDPSSQRPLRVTFLDKREESSYSPNLLRSRIVGVTV